MAENEKLIQEITGLVADSLSRLINDPYQVPVGISARHLHLSKEHVALLFGPGCALTPVKALSQPGQYACAEQVELAGPKGSIKKVRILGPVRASSQVEVARSDCRILGLNPPVRTSGDLDGTPGITLIGPKGKLILEQGVIIADRHIHMTPQDAAWFHVSHMDKVYAAVPGQKGGILEQVTVRVSEAGKLDFHMDTDDANAFGLEQGQWLSVRKGDS